jgi:aspartyl-tRNA(Asn)/glutamyl-tRNA(Gln) amidotransferase subunit A
MRRLTVAGLAADFRSGARRPSEVLEGCLADAALPCAQSVFIATTAERARVEATAADARLARGAALGPLDGVPVSWKDLFDLEGLPTTAGSRVLPSTPRAADAAAVARLRAAGAVCVGKTNLSEFAFSGLGLNPHFGTPANPFGSRAEPRVCGGSSSGAAASVARGLCAVGMGTDTSGSVRVPAAFTGLCGFRASRGRYPMAGLQGLSPLLDTLGVLARSVEDIARVDAVLAARARTDEDMVPLRIVLLDDFMDDTVEAAQRTRCLALFERLRRAGFAVSRGRAAPLTAAREAMTRHGTAVAAHAFHRHRALLDGPAAARIDPHIRARLESARGFLAADYLALLAARDSGLRALRACAPGTLFMFPTTPIVAPTIDHASDPARHAALNARALAHCMVGSLLDMPGIAMPSGLDARGLPTSVLFSMPRGRDAELLRACARIEAISAAEAA